jgi:hypothetical protein
MSESPRSAATELSQLSRRDAIRTAAIALTAFGAGSFPAIGRAAAAHVHGAVAQERAATSDAAYQPKAFLPHEWRLLRLLAEMIVPADEKSGSALDAGAPEFIDLLASNNAKLQRILTSGMLWLDHEMRRRHGVPFVEGSDQQRASMLDELAAEASGDDPDPGYPSYTESEQYARFSVYPTTASREVAPGAVFFGWVRRLVVDAFYTSPIGVADVGYLGNEVVRTFQVPKASLDAALERSPFREE